VAVVAFIMASVALPATLAPSIFGAVPYTAALSYLGWKTVGRKRLRMDDGGWSAELPG
jgi:hypothetical protein